MRRIENFRQFAIRSLSVISFCAVATLSGCSSTDTFQSPEPGTLTRETPSRTGVPQTFTGTPLLPGGTPSTFTGY